jgi:hypothetical protein
MNDAADVRSGSQELGVDRPLDVPRAISSQDHAVKSDEDHLVRGDLVESEC